MNAFSVGSAARPPSPNLSVEGYRGRPIRRGCASRLGRSCGAASPPGVATEHDATVRNMSRKSKQTKSISPTKATLEPAEGTEPEEPPTPIEPPTQPIEPSAGGGGGLGKAVLLALLAAIVAVVWKQQKK